MSYAESVMLVQARLKLANMREGDPLREPLRAAVDEYDRYRRETAEFFHAALHGPESPYWPVPLSPQEEEPT